MIPFVYYAKNEVYMMRFDLTAMSQRVSPLTHRIKPDKEKAQ